MPDILDLQREIDRLRALLWDHDIDPDPIREQFGPPTKEMSSMAAIVNTTLAARAPKMVESLLKGNALLRHLSSDEWRNVYGA